MNQCATIKSSDWSKHVPEGTTERLQKPWITYERLRNAEITQCPPRLRPCASMPPLGRFAPPSAMFMESTKSRQSSLKRLVPIAEREFRLFHPIPPVRII